MVKGRQQYKINAKNWNEHEMTNFTTNEPCYTCVSACMQEKTTLAIKYSLNSRSEVVVVFSHNHGCCANRLYLSHVSG